MVWLHAVLNITYECIYDSNTYFEWTFTPTVLQKFVSNAYCSVWFYFILSLKAMNMIDLYFILVSCLKRLKYCSQEWCYIFWNDSRVWEYTCISLKNIDSYDYWFRAVILFNFITENLIFFVIWNKLSSRENYWCITIFSNLH